MHLRVGDKVRHIFDARISGVVAEIKQVDSNRMSTGGSFTPQRYALIESKTGQRTWVLFDDVMKDE